MRTYETGVRDMAGTYRKFAESPDRGEILEHAERIRDIVAGGCEVVFLEKTYQLISTVPFVVGESGELE